MSAVVSSLERLGRSVVKIVEELGYGASLLGESMYWLVFGYFRKQPVRIPSVFEQMMERNMEQCQERGKEYVK